MFQSVPIASGPVTGHDQKEPGSILFVPSLQVLLYIDEIPPEPSLPRLNGPSSLSLFS